MECEFCHKILSCKGAITKHQKSTKYCLLIQGKSGINFECKSCTNKYTQKIDLERHQLKCSKLKTQNITHEKERIILSKDELIHSLKDRIKKLEKMLENIATAAASRPTNIQNNKIGQIINNLTPLTDQHFEENVKNLTIDHIKGGAAGYAKYALEYPLKDRVVCMDFSRRKIGYKNSEGEVVTDPEMTKLSRKLFKAIDDHNSKLISEYLKELQEKLFSTGGNQEMSESETNLLQTQSDELFEYINTISSHKRDVKDIGNGLKPEIYHDFLKNVCSGTVQ